MLNTLYIKELTFNSAHYIPEHPKCGALHGHTYFVRDMVIECEEGEFVDFGIIKTIIKEFDHALIISKRDELYWQEVNTVIVDKGLGVHLNIVTVDGIPTVEDISKEIQKRLLMVHGIKNVGFMLCEGPNQGAVV